MEKRDDVTILFRKYIDKELSAEELGELRNFLAKTEENRRLFNDFLFLYKVELQIKAKATLDASKSWNTLLHKISIRKRRLMAKWITAASVVLLGFSSLFYFVSYTPKEKASLLALYPNKAIDKAMLTLSGGQIILMNGNIATPIKDINGVVIGNNFRGQLIYKRNNLTAYNKIVVPKGSTYQVTLCDGTRVFLNSESELEYPIGFTKARNVKLKGEAYFEVTHNKYAPFIVNCGNNIRVRVLGTKFNVSAYAERNVAVTLVSGRVAVGSPLDKVVLKPSEQVEISKGRMAKQQVNADLYISWVTGTYEFSNVTMGDIMTQLSLWYGVKIRFASPELSNIAFTGALMKHESLGYALNLIKEISNLDFKDDNGSIIVTENDKREN